MTSSSKKKLALRRLAAATRSDGTVPCSVVDELARDLQVSCRQVRRWQAEQRSAGSDEATFPDLLDHDATESPYGALIVVGDSPRGYIPTQKHLTVLAASPTRKAAWRTIASEPGVPGYRGFVGALKRLEGGLAGMVLGDGAKTLVNKRVYAPQIIARRNQRWELDEQELPIRVIPRRGTVPFHPRKLNIIDCATRAIMASCVYQGAATSSLVAAVIAKAVRGRMYTDESTGELVFVGGVPDEIVWDNAACNLSEHVTAVSLALDFIGTAVNPHAGYEKGKVERFHRTEQSELYDTLPGAVHGPKSFTTTQYWNPKNLSELLSIEMLTQLSEEYEDRYNLERGHSALHGQTPLSAWQADLSPLRIAEDEALYDAMMKPSKLHTVNKSGIRFEKQDYLAPELNGYVGRKVEIRYLPHLRPEDRYLEVFFNDVWLCTALPAENLDADMRRDILGARRKQYQQASALAKQGAQLRRDSAEDVIAARMQAAQDAQAAAREASEAAKAQAKAEERAARVRQEDDSAAFDEAAQQERAGGWAAAPIVRRLPRDMPTLGQVNPRFVVGADTSAVDLLALLRRLEQTDDGPGEAETPGEPASNGENP